MKVYVVTYDNGDKNREIGEYFRDEIKEGSAVFLGGSTYGIASKLSGKEVLDSLAKRFDFDANKHHLAVIKAPKGSVWALPTQEVTNNTPNSGPVAAMFLTPFKYHDR